MGVVPTPGVLRTRGQALYLHPFQVKATAGAPRAILGDSRFSGCSYDRKGACIRRTASLDVEGRLDSSEPWNRRPDGQEKPDVHNAELSASKFMDDVNG